MMGSGLRAGSSPGENPMEAVREFLQDMTRTIELLCTRYNAEARTLETSAFENPDLHTSLLTGTPSVSVDILRSREMSDFPLPSESFQSSSTSGHVLPGDRYEEGKLGQLPDWFSQGCSFERGASMTSLEERPLNEVIFEPDTFGRTLDTNSQDNSFETKNRDALTTFLEDMKRTIETWSTRYNLLSEGKAIAPREEADMDVVDATRTVEAVCSQPHSGDSNVRVMDQLEVGPDGVSFPAQDVPVVQVSEQEKAARVLNGKADGACLVLNERGICASQGGQGREDNNSHLLGEDTSGLRPPYDHDVPAQEMADAQEPQVNLSTINLDVDPVQNQSQQDVQEMNVAIASKNDGKNGDGFESQHVNQEELNVRSPGLVPKNEQLDLAISAKNADGLARQSSRRRVDLVGSPDWLPQGWKTEIKIRNNGNSAGSKDKYYFDPVSKRRFRSKKEVFSFLETGKLGRYKSRPKIKPVRKLLGSKPASAGPVNDVRQVETASKRNTSGVASSSTSDQNPPSTSAPSVVPSIPPPAGLLSNVFMPYRPGQPSEWLVYESLASLPLPVFEHFRYADYHLGKSNGNKAPAPRPWFFNNPEVPWRPLVDRSDMDKAVETGVGTQLSEATRKDFATAGKRSSKKSSK